jgi:hypothetical protein
LLPVRECSSSRRSSGGILRTVHPESFGTLANPRLPAIAATTVQACTRRDAADRAAWSEGTRGSPRAEDDSGSPRPDAVADT